MAAEPVVPRTALGAYPHTRALRDGRVTSTRLRLEFAEVAPVNRAFAPMVREQRFDVCELAIATALQAKAHGKPIVVLPVTVAARFQEAALLCRADSDLHGPADLAGRRVGVRAYSQTTGMWLRGILAERHGVPAEIRPELLMELQRLFRAGRAAAPSSPMAIDPLPMSRAALQPAIELALGYAEVQGLLPRRLGRTEIWEDLPEELAA